MQNLNKIIFLFFFVGILLILYYFYDKYKDNIFDKIKKKKRKNQQQIEYSIILDIFDSFIDKITPRNVILFIGTITPIIVIFIVGRLAIKEISQVLVTQTNQTITSMFPNINGPTLLFMFIIGIMITYFSIVRQY